MLLPIDLMAATREVSLCLKSFLQNQRRKNMQQFRLRNLQHDVPEGIMTKCPNCKKNMYTKELIKNFKLCLHCRYHFPMNSNERLESFLDEGSFEEFNENMISENPLKFPDYLEKLGKRSAKNRFE